MTELDLVPQNTPAEGSESTANPRWQTPPEPLDPIKDFDSGALRPELVAAIKKLGWNTPTPVQELCLPHTLVGRDVAGFAQTGTGKTGVFLITAINRFLARRHDGSVQPEIACPFALVLVPTRELAIQIQSDGEPFFEQFNIKSLAVYGGIDYEKK